MLAPTLGPAPDVATRPCTRGSVRGLNHCLISVTGTATLVDCLYAVEINLIHDRRIIDVLGDIRCNRSYGPPTAGAGSGLLVILRREIDLIAPLNDEVTLVV